MNQSEGLLILGVVVFVIGLVLFFISQIIGSCLLPIAIIFLIVYATDKAKKKDDDNKNKPVKGLAPLGENCHAPGGCGGMGWLN